MDGCRRFLLLRPLERSRRRRHSRNLEQSHIPLLKAHAEIATKEFSRNPICEPAGTPEDISWVS
ncbi:MAG: hypothetical protein DMF04_12060, partial [Verrucomicrobia bacterium]